MCQKKALIIVLCVSLTVLFVSVSPSDAYEVKAIGIGHNRDAAIRNAQRNAVEQALGAYIESESTVIDQKLKDCIVSSASGYINQFDVLEEGKNLHDGMYKVEILASVVDLKIEFGRRRLIVLHNRRTPGDLAYNSKGIQTVLDLVEDRLAGYGFRVFLSDQLRRIKQQIIDTAIDEKTAMHIARQENGDAVVLVTMNAGVGETPQGYKLIQCTLSLKSYDPTTGDLFANVQEEGKTIARGGDYGIETGISQVATTIGRKGADALSSKIVRRFSAADTKREAFSVLIFKGFGTDAQMAIEDLIADTLKWDYRIVSQAGSYLEIEAFVKMEPTALRREFMKAAESSRIPLRPAELKGARIVFSAPGNGAGK